MTCYILHKPSKEGIPNLALVSTYVGDATLIPNVSVNYDEVTHTDVYADYERVFRRASNWEHQH